MPSLTPNKVVETSYTSRFVEIPPSFLKEPLPSPITVTQVDFKEGGLPERTGLYAVVLDGVLTPNECEELLRLAEESVEDSSVPHPESAGIDASDDRGKAAIKWRPAMVNAGPGREIYVQDYRHCDRIVWDDEEIAERIWERCVQAPGIEEALSKIEGDGSKKVQGYGQARDGWKWKFARLNERMRFLRYGKGMYFKEHFDGNYVDPPTGQTSFYTLHLYLNDNTSQSNAKEPLTGGATSFLANDLERKMDVDPKVGRVLIFQQRDLVHSGAEVYSGIKYTMRTDLMYKLVERPPRVERRR